MQVGAEWKALALGANFSQDDVDENRVRYVHSGRPSANTEDLFRFHLWDGNNQSPVYPFLLVLLRTPKGMVNLVQDLSTGDGEECIGGVEYMWGVP